MKTSASSATTSPRRPQQQRRSDDRAEHQDSGLKWNLSTGAVACPLRARCARPLKQDEAADHRSSAAQHRGEEGRDPCARGAQVVAAARSRRRTAPKTMNMTPDQKSLAFFSVHACALAMSPRSRCDPFVWLMHGYPALTGLSDACARKLHDLLVLRQFGAHEVLRTRPRSSAPARRPSAPAARASRATAAPLCTPCSDSSITSRRRAGRREHAEPGRHVETAAARSRPSSAHRASTPSGAVGRHREGAQLAGFDLRAARTPGCRT